MIRVLVGCQNDRCAEEMSHYLDAVRMLGGQPICQICYEEGNYATDALWGELPEISMGDLSP